MKESIQRCGGKQSSANMKGAHASIEQCRLIELNKYSEGRAKNPLFFPVLKTIILKIAKTESSQLCGESHWYSGSVIKD